MEQDNVVSIDKYRERRDNRQALARAAYWALIIEDSHRSLEYAERQREDALREAGMLPEERGLDG